MRYFIKLMIENSTMTEQLSDYYKNIFKPRIGREACVFYIPNIVRCSVMHKYGLVSFEYIYRFFFTIFCLVKAQDLLEDKQSSSVGYLITRILYMLFMFYLYIFSVFLTSVRPELRHFYYLLCKKWFSGYKWRKMWKCDKKIQNTQKMTNNMLSFYSHLLFRP